jgi:hypothetical protein
MKDAVIYLISEQMEQDENGVFRSVPIKRRQYCKVKNVTSREFFDGGRNGLNPEYQFTMFAGDYNGERSLEYNGQAYGIYRKYLADGDYLELYVERKGATNGLEND